MSNPAGRRTESLAPPAGAIAPTARTRLKRRPQRGAYDRETIHAILDEAFLCHVGFVYEGSPRVIPTVYARSGNDLYLHGSSANRMLRSLCRGECCVTVTLVDGLVLARSAFHQSANYRSVVIYGQGEQVSDEADKAEALRLIVEHAIPGRWKDVRPPSREEVLQTLVVRVPIAEASAKVRQGDPIDDEADHALPCWAGQIPLTQRAGAPVDDALLPDGVPAPDYAREYRRPVEAGGQPRR